jgi:hypothetical protein
MKTEPSQEISLKLQKIHDKEQSGGGGGVGDRSDGKETG